MSKHHVSTTINGEPVEFLCETQQTLLDVLRDELDLTGSKEGCASGDCGACSVIVDGRLVCSCLMLGVEAEGTTITTIEGIAQGDQLHPVQQKFLEHAALQCGFCTPGLIVATQGAARREPEPDRERRRATGWPATCAAAPATTRSIRAVHGRRRRNARGDRLHELRCIRSEGRRHASDPSRRRGQGDRPRHVRRRHADAGHAVGQGDAHARTRMRASCRSTRARREKLPGVKAVVTAADFPDIPSEEAFVGEGPMNFRDLSRNCMARDKALYEGHAVAAVAATTAGDRRRGARPDRREVRGAAVRHRRRGGDEGRTRRSCTTTCSPPASSRSRPSRRTSPSVLAFEKGDVEAGFKEADVIVEGRYTTQPVHQAYIEPHACLCSYGADGQVTIFSSSQGHFMVRAYCAKLLGIDISNIRAVPAEIGGGFGGKTLVYLEPLALALSKKCGRPVKMQMTREEVFRASGPTSGATIEVKLGAKKDGTIVAAQAGAEVPGRRLPGLADRAGLHVRLRDVRHPERRGRRLRRGQQPAEGGGVSRAGRADLLLRGRKRDGRPGAQAGHGSDRAAREERRAKNGTKTHYGPTHQNIGFLATLEAAKNHPHWKSPLKPGQGRGIACGFWFNIGGEFIARGAHHRGRHGGGGVGQPRHRRLARLDRHDGGRGAGRAGREGAHDRRRHGVDRLHLPDRRQPRSPSPPAWRRPRRPRRWSRS